MKSLYEKEPSEFYKRVKEYIIENKIAEKIHELVLSNHRLTFRKQILEEALTAYNTSKYLFCSVIPLQVEGIFYDYCLELGIPEESIKSVSLSEKLDLITKNNPQYSNFEYYTFRFPLMRNKVAHGKLIEENIEHLADYLMLDLYDVCSMMNSFALPVNQAINIIKVVKDNLEDKKGFVRYALFYNVQIPAFYGLEKEIGQIREKIYERPFWDFLHELALGDSQALKIGVLKIVKDLDKAEINKSWCKEFYPILNSLDPKDLDKDEFLDHLNYFENNKENIL